MAGKKVYSKIFWGTSLWILISLVVFYIFQVIQLTELGFQIGEYERGLEKSRREIANLETSLSRYSNLENFEKKLETLGYQEIDKIDYLVAPGSVVAKGE